jgi:pimeloyl-ACP methyl ester carboxylesterase
MVQAPRAIAWFGDRFAALMRRRPGLGVRAMEIGACEADRRLLAEPMGREALAESFLGAMRGGCAPMIEDYLVCCRDWGFDPAEARGTVSIWHGLRDKLVPVEAARALASRLPDARLNIDPDEGHFFYKRRIEDILAGIIDRAGGATCASRPRPQESPQQALRAQAR